MAWNVPGPARPARRRAGRLRTVLAALAAILPVPSTAQVTTTVLASSGEWTVLEIHRAHGPDETPALIVGLHGYGIHEGQMATLVAVRPDIPHVYVAARGHHVAPEGGHAWFPVTLEEDTVVFDEAELVRAVDAVADLLPRLAERFGADPGRIHVVGYSQGATLALHMALARPEAAASYAAFAGALLPLDTDTVLGQSAPAPVLIGHGIRDPLISADDVRTSATRLRAAGRTVEVAAFAVPHVVSAAGRRRIEDWIETGEFGGD